MSLKEFPHGDTDFLTFSVVAFHISVHCWFTETNLRFHHVKMLMLGEARQNAPEAADLIGFLCFGMIANVIQMKLLEGKDSPS